MGIYDAKCYDDFKDRVATCTLKPIHRNEFNAPPKMSYNNRAERQAVEKPSVPLFGTNSQRTTAYPSEKDSTGRGTTLTEKMPRNGHEFERELRRRPTADAKLQLLHQVLDKRELVAKFFGREVDGEMLRQILAALQEVTDRGNSDGIARRFFVTLVTECPVSIGAACSFLDAEERGVIARLLAQDRASDEKEDVLVCAAFGMPPSSVAAAAASLAHEAPREALREESSCEKYVDRTSGESIPHDEAGAVTSAESAKTGGGHSAADDTGVDVMD